MQDGPGATELIVGGPRANSVESSGQPGSKEAARAELLAMWQRTKANIVLGTVDALPLVGKIGKAGKLAALVERFPRLAQIAASAEKIGPAASRAKSGLEATGLLGNTTPDVQRGKIESGIWGAISLVVPGTSIVDGLEQGYVDVKKLPGLLKDLAGTRGGLAAEAADTQARPEVRRAVSTFLPDVISNVDTRREHPAPRSMLTRIARGVSPRRLLGGAVMGAVGGFALRSLLK